jgi:hypothetical protein
VFDDGPIDEIVFAVLCVIVIVGAVEFARRWRRKRG